MAFIRAVACFLEMMPSVDLILINHYQPKICADCMHCSFHSNNRYSTGCEQVTSYTCKFIGDTLPSSMLAHMYMYMYICVCSLQPTNDSFVHCISSDNQGYQDWPHGHNSCSLNAESSVCNLTFMQAHSCSQ